MPGKSNKPSERAAFFLAALMGTAGFGHESASAGAEAGSSGAAAPAGGPVLMPVDEAVRDPDLMAFRAGLLASVRVRDVEAVVAIAHPNIKLSFGGEQGRETFRRWLEEDPSFGGDGYWRELERSLELGGVFEGPDTYCTPYVFCLDIPGCETCDPYETLVAVSDRAPVHAAPDPDSPVVATLSYGVVAVIDTRHQPWSRVRVAGHSSASGTPLEGYVTAPAFRSPIDYRGRFERQKDGAWLMTVFIAGD